jgi:hypothetical protein
MTVCAAWACPGMGQGNDRGTQYRSGIYCADEAEREPPPPTPARASSLAPYQQLHRVGPIRGPSSSL